MKVYYLFFSLLITLTIISCSDDDDNQNTPDPVINNNILGSVNLYNEGTTSVDDSGMTIKLEGTNLSTITNDEGDFNLEDIPFETYTIVYEKDGFGTYKNFNLEHTNTGSPTIITVIPSLGQISTTKITELTANVSGPNVLFSATTDPGGNNANTRYFRFFLSTDSNVSNENYSYHSPGLISQINPNEFMLTPEDFTEYGFSSGETVYMRVYGESYWTNEYEDPNLGRTIFPNLNMNTVDAVSFVIP